MSRKGALFRSLVFVLISAILGASGQNLPKTVKLPEAVKLPDGQIVNIPDFTADSWEPFLLHKTQRQLMVWSYSGELRTVFFGTAWSLAKKDASGNVTMLAIVSRDPAGEPYLFAWAESRKKGEWYEALITDKGALVVGDESVFSWKLRNNVAIKEVRVDVIYKGRRVGKRVFKNLNIESEPVIPPKRTAKASPQFLTSAPRGSLLLLSWR